MFKIQLGCLIASASILIACNKEAETVNTSLSSPVKQSVSNSNETKSEIVHRTTKGKKYHRAGCSYLRKSDIEVSRSEAENDGLEPCSRCDP